MSRFVLPVASVAATVPGKEVSAPSVPIANPEMVDVAELEVYTKRPSGVIACQQVAAPSVGTLALIGASIPLGSAAYDEMAEAFVPSRRPGFRYQCRSVRRERNRERAGAHGSCHNDGAECAIQLDMEGVDSIVELLRHQ